MTIKEAIKNVALIQGKWYIVDGERKAPLTNRQVKQLNEKDNSIR